jgi:hypothetical protein
MMINDSARLNRLLVVAIATSTLALVAIGALAGYYAHSNGIGTALENPKIDMPCEDEVYLWARDVKRVFFQIRLAESFADSGEYRMAQNSVNVGQAIVQNITVPACDERVATVSNMLVNTLASMSNQYTLLRSGKVSDAYIAETEATAQKQKAVEVLLKLEKSYNYDYGIFTP